MNYGKIQISQNKGYVDTSYLKLLEAKFSVIKQRSYELMNIKAGQHVLDLGCGPGSDTLSLGIQVGSAGFVLGIDYDLAMVNTANERARNAQADSWIQHRQGLAAALPVDSEQFDACRSERLFQHLLEPEKALCEMIRVTKMGGRVVVVDTDWGSLSIHTQETDIERRMVRFNAEHDVNNGYSGRGLYSLFKHYKLHAINIECVTFSMTHYELARKVLVLDQLEKKALAQGVINSNELQRWRSNLQEIERRGSFFASFNVVLIAGIKN